LTKNVYFTTRIFFKSFLSVPTLPHIQLDGCMVAMGRPHLRFDWNRPPSLHPKSPPTSVDVTK